MNEHAKYYTESCTAATKNREDTLDIKPEGITQRMKMRDVMRVAINKVMQQNKLDILVYPTVTMPPAMIGQASQPQVNNCPLGRIPLSADPGIPETTVETDKTATREPMAVGISFWSGIGKEPTVIGAFWPVENAKADERQGAMPI